MIADLCLCDLHSLSCFHAARKLRTVLTNRMLRFLHDKSQKEKEQYDIFYRDYGIFLKEGIITSTEQSEKVQTV